MKVIILAGGYGTRLSEYTERIPKPLIKIGKLPILIHIMKHYAKYGYTDFIVALGYKGSLIKNYFKQNKFPWSIKLVDTGLKTMTGGRLKRLEKYINKERFMLTYGDGVSNLNIKKLVDFHIKNAAIGTLTAVRPPARFGAIKLNNNFVSYFKEKSKLDEGWINGGFFVFESKFIKYIKEDQTYLEKEPLEKLSKQKKLIAFKHVNFWQCMDTLRDKKILEEAYKKKKF